jgi:DNA-binding beta-propeller fold protein YncE
MDLGAALGRMNDMDRRAFLLAGAAVPSGLALGGRGEAARARPVALVTADLEDHVVVLDPATARTLARIRTAAGPRSIEAVDSRLAVVAHTQAGLVSVLDAVARDVRFELDDFAAPRYTAVHPRRRIAYITDSAAAEVVSVDATRGRVLSRTPVPGPARHVSIDRAGSALWTSLGSKAERVAVLSLDNPRRPHLECTFTPPFLAHDVVFAPDRTHVWVTAGAGRRIAIYGRSTPDVVRLVPADRAPQHVAFVGDLAFVASGDDGTVSIHRLDGRLVRRAQVPVGSYNVSYGRGRVVTPSLSLGTVSLLDDRGRVRAVRTVARAAHDACIVSDPRKELQ